MTVREGGYQTGRSYQWYRAMGHNPLSAFHMRHGGLILQIEIFVLSAMIGYILGIILLAGLR
jgi:hypothetical protein